VSRAKVFHGKVHTSYVRRPKQPWVSQFSAVVVTTSEAKAAKLLGTTLGDVRTYWSKVNADSPNARARYAAERPDRVFVWVEDFGGAEGAIEMRVSPGGRGLELASEAK
jgi:hypothetical protein